MKLIFVKNLAGKISKRGFTLVEVLLYVAIAGFIFGGILAFVEVVFYSRAKQEIIAEAEYAGTQILRTITQYGRNAKSIAYPPASSTAAILNLEMVEAGINPTVFELRDGSIRMSERGGATTTLTSSRLQPKNLIFTNLGRSGTDGGFRVEFTLRWNNIDGHPNYEYEKYFVGSASLRDN